MKEIEIRLSLPEEIKEFVKITSQCPYDVDLLSGRYVVDGKSILGIFSLDLTQPIVVRIYSDECDKFLEEVKPYMA